MEVHVSNLRSFEAHLGALPKVQGQAGPQCETVSKTKTTNKTKTQETYKMKSGKLWVQDYTRRQQYPVSKIKTKTKANKQTKKNPKTQNQNKPCKPLHTSFNAW